MTDAKVFTNDALAKPGGEEKSVAADQLMRFMRKGDDLSGLVPDSLVEPEVGRVEGSFDQELMERVALAVESEIDKAEKADRDPNMKRALASAGVNESMYLQMAMHPDYRLVCQRVYTAFVLLPRWSSVCRAMSKSAMAGDVAAARWVRDQVESGDKGLEEALKAIESEGEASLGRHAGELLLDLQRLLEESKRAETPEALVEEAKADVAVQHQRPEPEIRVDLMNWSDGDDV